MPASTETIGFWPRVWAFVVDTACLSLLLVPLGLFSYLMAPWLGSESSLLDLLLHWVLPFGLVFWCWKRWLATPGKMLIRAEIVDARSLQPPSNRQLLIRYLGYFISMLPLGLGMLWVLVDRRDQAWHDKLAGTIVMRTPQPFFSPLTSRLIHCFSVLVALALGLGAVLGIGWLRSDWQGFQGSYRLLQEAVDSGTMQGVLGTTESCWNGAWQETAGCTGPLCSLQGSFFLRSCLDNCRPTRSTCTRIIPNGELSVRVWQSRCEELERPGFDCVLLIGTMSLYCRGLQK